MNGIAVALLVVAAFDPLMVSSRLSAVPSDRRRAGVAAATAAAVVLVWIARPVLDALGIEPESYWIAAGLVLAAAGAVRVAVPRGVRPVGMGHGGSWAVPVAYPTVLGPELVMASSAAGAHHDGAVATLAVLVCAAVVAAAPVPAPPLVAALARLAAAGQVVLAVALVVDGIRGV